MAEVIYQATRHSCLKEIEMDIDEKALDLGSIVQCSCGSQYIRRENQIDGPFWARHLSPER